MTTWNPSDKAAGLTLSGGNLVATHTGTNAFYETVRGTTSKSGGGKFVAKLTFSNIGTPAECGFGVANASASLGNTAPDYLGVDANGVACYNGGVAYNNANISTIAAGQGPFFAFDLTNSTLKTSADGTTWSGPAAFTVPAGAVFLAVCLYDTGDVATLDPAPTGWTLAGYSNWDGLGLATGALAATEAPDTFAATGGVEVFVTLAATEPRDVFAGVGAVAVSGALVASEAADIFAGSGTVATAGTVAGSWASTEASDAFAAFGGTVIAGSLAATEPSDVFAATGGILAPLTGTLAATERRDVVAVVGVVTVPAMSEAMIIIPAEAHAGRAAAFPIIFAQAEPSVLICSEPRQRVLP